MQASNLATLDKKKGFLAFHVLIILFKKLSMRNKFSSSGTELLETLIKYSITYDKAMAGQCRIWTHLLPKTGGVGPIFGGVIIF